MAIFTTSGSKIWITALTTAPATFDAAGYAALTYTEVKATESIGALGDESTEVTFDDLGLGRTIKVKGQRNAGTLSIVCALDDADAGQNLLRTAERNDTNVDYHFRIQLDNKITGPGVNAIRYFSGRIMSAKEVLDTANNIAKLESMISINTAIVAVADT